MTTESMFNLLSDPRVQVKVSSVFQGNQQQFGRQHLIDGSLETCWSSEPGASHQLRIDLGRPVHAHTLHLMFQGGYAARTLHVWCARTRGPYVWDRVATLHPENTSALQTFAVLPCAETVLAVQLVIEESADLYGRVVLYSLGVLGTEAAS